MRPVDAQTKQKVAFGGIIYILIDSQQIHKKLDTIDNVAALVFRAFYILRVSWWWWLA